MLNGIDNNIRYFCEDCPIIKAYFNAGPYGHDYESLARLFKVNPHLTGYIITFTLRQIGQGVYPYKIGFYTPREKCCGKCINQTNFEKGCDLKIDAIEDCIKLNHKFFKDANRGRTITYEK
jgi:hypothetical protein